MGTKNQPGAFDCYTAAEPDEPMFILLGRDRHASALVRLWAEMREREGENSAKVAEARELADRLEKFAQEQGKSVLTLDSVAMFASTLVKSTAIETKPIEPPKERLEKNRFLAEGDIVVAQRGIPGRLEKIFNDEDPEPVRGQANVLYPRRSHATTVSLALLRKAQPEEIEQYRQMGGIF